MTEPEDRIPTIGTHRGVRLHADQSPERLAVVRAEIDQVFGLEGRTDELFRWVKWRPNSPESRLLAGALISAAHQVAVEQRRPGPGIDLALLGAHLAGLDGDRARDRIHFDTMWAPRWAPGSENRPVRRPQPLPPRPPWSRPQPADD